MKQFVMCYEDFNELQEQGNNMEDVDDEYDLIAPCTQNVEHSDKALGNEDLQPDFNENYNLSDETSYCFLVGRAEVGKSLVTKALYQAASKYYHYTRAGVDFHEAKVLMPAPTGKATYNIKANTIYTALKIAAFHAIVGSRN